MAIVGAGAGGLYTALQLAKHPAALGAGRTAADICLFEKEPQVGGRLKAVPQYDNDPGSPVFGVGGRRILPGHTVILDLASELGVGLEQPVPPLDLVYARGEFALADDPTGHRDGKQDRLLPLYDAAAVAAQIAPEILDAAGGDVEYAGYLQLFAVGRDPGTDFSEFPDWPAFIVETLGLPAFIYMRDMTRFRGEITLHDADAASAGEFSVAADVKNFVEFLDTEFHDGGTPYYPVGSMQALTFGMADAAIERGVRVYVSEPVLSVDRSGAGYRLRSAAHTVTASRVILAVPPAALSTIGGEVIDAIRSQPQYNFKNQPIVTITQWWPYPWWEPLRYKNDSTPAGRIWRAWMDRSAGCGTFLEIPMDPSSQSQNVTRSVYSDDPVCIEFWRNTFAERGLSGVEAEIEANLESMFNDNDMTTPDVGELPPPDKTYFQYWPAAWSFLGAGTPTTNEEIVTWALDPLETGEWVSLVGEAYNPIRSGWSVAAYQSAVHLLNQRYGLALSRAYEPPFFQ
ncbi:MAG: FAD-dependent oxidoreductase [Deltaproteobacteria bacterium]|nr:FAD-dependent oxidoreductase [Deltaproteobacteria bacterium]